MGRMAKRGQMGRVGTLAMSALLILGGGAWAQAPDRRAASAAIMQADRDFSRAVANRDRNAFLSFLADKVTFNAGTANERQGRDAIMMGWSDFFEKDGPSLTWAPTEAIVSAAGNEGATTGTAVLKSKAADGTMQEQRTAYVTVWRKQGDGSWKVVADTGSTITR